MARLIGIVGGIRFSLSDVFFFWSFLGGILDSYLEETGVFQADTRFEYISMEWFIFSTRSTVLHFHTMTPYSG